MAPLSEMVRLSELATIRTGASIRGKLPVDPHGNVLAIQQRDISTGGVSANLERIAYPKFESDRLRDGDVLLRSKGSPLVAAEFKEQHDVPMPTIAAAAVLILRPKSDRIKSRYLVWLLNSNWAQEIFSIIKTGTYISVISVRDLREVSIPLPPVAEQASICNLSELAKRHENLATQYRQKLDTFLVAKTINPTNAGLEWRNKNVNR
jgi:hypothetical protein